jgi:hypothetical protein
MTFLFYILSYVHCIPEDLVKSIQRIQIGKDGTKLRRTVPTKGPDARQNETPRSTDSKGEFLRRFTKEVDKLLTLRQK